MLYKSGSRDRERNALSVGFLSSGAVSVAARNKYASMGLKWSIDQPTASCS